MTSISRHACLSGLLLFAALSHTARAVDIVNGWSAPSSITKIYSVWSFTYFKLSSTPNGCGHADFWSLTTQDTAAAKAKLSLLLSAYTSGKSVSLRCENSQLTDFEIFD
ncbi:MAG: hypothetical protein ABI769_13030 [Pseudomonadota bacterium]